MMSELVKHDLIFLSETWLDIGNKAIDDEDLKISGYDFTNIPRTNIHKKALRSSGGLALYIKKSIAKSVTIEKQICDHFIVVSIKEVDSKMFIIFSYIPPHDTTHLCKTCDGNYIETLYDLYVNLSCDGNVFICGDLNGRTGEVSDMPVDYLFNNFFFDDNDTVFENLPDYDSQLPTRHSEDKTCNTQGRSLLGLFKESDLRIVNGRHPGDPTGKFTFYRGEARSVIDYLISQSRNFDNILTFSVSNKGCGTVYT